MKKITFITLCALFSVLSFGQTSNLEQAINEGLTQLDSAKTIADMQSVANRFQRIAMAETSRWEPLYHLAYTQIIISFWEKEGDKKDAALDLAEKNIEKALSINGDKSELHALQGFLYQGRIQVSSMRGMTYSQKASSIIEQAINENPENPRALYLMAQNIYYTPKMFGGGCENALPKYLEAKEKFEKENCNSGIAPRWGAKSNLRAIENCNSKK